MTLDARAANTSAWGSEHHLSTWLLQIGMQPVRGRPLRERVQVLLRLVDERYAKGSGTRYGTSAKAVT